MINAILAAAARALQEKLGSVTFAGRSNLLPLLLNDVADIVLAAATPLIRAAVLEEAARVAENFPYFVTREKIADAIRALKQEMK